MGYYTWLQVGFELVVPSQPLNYLELQAYNIMPGFTQQDSASRSQVPCPSPCTKTESVRSKVTEYLGHVKHAFSAHMVFQCPFRNIIRKVPPKCENASQWQCPVSHVQGFGLDLQHQKEKDKKSKGNFSQNSQTYSEGQDLAYRIQAISFLLL